MSTSTDAIMAYGVDLGGNGEVEGDTETFNHFIDVFKLDRDQVEDQPDEIANAVEKPLSKLGLELVGHCSDGARAYVLAIAKTRREASRGYPVEVGTELPAIPVKPELELRKLLKQLKVTKKPTYLLFSWWG